MGKKKNKKRSSSFPQITFKNTEGIEYKIKWKAPGKSWNADGLCDSPDSKNPEIWINPEVKSTRLLEILIEEIFHSFCFEKNEKTARKFASTLKKIIIQLYSSQRIISI
jgi:hypothetical protein